MSAGCSTTLRSGLPGLRLSEGGRICDRFKSISAEARRVQMSDRAPTGNRRGRMPSQSSAAATARLHFGRPCQLCSLILAWLQFGHGRCAGQGRSSADLGPRSFSLGADHFPTSLSLHLHLSSPSKLLVPSHPQHPHPLPFAPQRSQGFSPQLAPASPPSPPSLLHAQCRPKLCKSAAPLSSLRLRRSLHLPDSLR